MSTTNASSNTATVASNNVLFSDTKAKTATNKKTPLPVTVIVPTKEKEIQPTTKSTEVTKESLSVQKHIPTIQEMQEKAEKMHILSLKYNSLSIKKRELELFSISHDGDTARMRLTDTKGMEFESSNPTCIRQLLEIWKKSYADALAKTEEEMRILLEA